MPFKARNLRKKSGGRRGTTRGPGSSKPRRGSHGGQPARNSSAQARTDARTKSHNPYSTSKGDRSAPGAGAASRESSPNRETPSTSTAYEDWRTGSGKPRTEPSMHTNHKSRGTEPLTSPGQGTGAIAAWGLGGGPTMAACERVALTEQTRSRRGHPARRKEAARAPVASIAWPR